ncbi:hypothetical protein LCGC14_0147110 [marine sediment metagenome]|uniref:Uncharacterized protein n=1 Tax=marine sediment metagenome TaxID=412755 RepID=A0A0F9V3M2_9ZZZZ
MRRQSKPWFPVSDYRMPEIIYCRVSNVDLDKYTLTAVGDIGNRSFFSLPWASPYVNINQGQGTYCIPEVGSRGYVVIPSDNTDPFFLTFIMPQSTDFYRGGRSKKLNPGDQVMISEDGNGVIVRKGGVTQIMSTPICQRMFIPINNFIKDYCENFQLFSAGGTMTWVVNKTLLNKTAFELRAKTQAELPPTIKFALGDLTGLLDELPMTGVTAPADIHGLLSIGEGLFTMRIDAVGNCEMKGLESSETWLTGKTITAPVIKFGSIAASSPAAKGDAVIQLLTSFLNAFINNSEISTLGNMGAPVVTNPAIITELTTILGQVSTIASLKVLIE